MYMFQQVNHTDKYTLNPKPLAHVSLHSWIPHLSGNRELGGVMVALYERTAPILLCTLWSNTIIFIFQTLLYRKIRTGRSTEILVARKQHFQLIPIRTQLDIWTTHGWPYFPRFLTNWQHKTARMRSSPSPGSSLICRWYDKNMIYAPVSLCISRACNSATIPP